MVWPRMSSSMVLRLVRSLTDVLSIFSVELSSLVTELAVLEPDP